MSGGGVGGGLGGILGSVLGVALAPETGGLSLAIPALGGALGGIGGNLLGDAVTGEQVSPGGLALSGIGGGVGGGLSGALSGAGGLAGGGGASAASAADPFGAAGGITSDAGFAGAVGSDVVPGGSFATSLTPGVAASGTGSSIDFASGAGSALPGEVSVSGSSGAPLSLGSFGDPATAPITGAGGASPTDFSFADQSGAFGGLGGNAAPTASEFGGANSGVWNWLKQNKDWLMPAGAALNVGKQLITGSNTPGAADLSANNALLRQIASNSANGLNPQQGAAFSQNLKATQDAIRAKYANLGLSGSTAEMQDLENARLNNTGAQAGAISGNINQAISAVGGANNGIGQLAQAQANDDRALQEAIMALALSSAWGLGQK